MDGQPRVVCIRIDGPGVCDHDDGCSWPETKLSTQATRSTKITHAMKLMNTNLNLRRIIIILNFHDLSSSSIILSFYCPLIDTCKYLMIE